MSGGKGGGQTTTTEIPSWIQGPASRNLQRAEQLAQVGYMPYYGPSVAAFTPMQTQAMQSTADAASAFGLAPQMDVMAGMPQAQDFGVRRRLLTGCLPVRRQAVTVFWVK